MNFTEDDLDNLSTLARIDIKPDEKGKMLVDMQAILGYVSEINDIEGDISKMSYPHNTITRQDVVTHERGLNTEKLLGEAPEQENGYIKVEQVFK